MVDIVKRSDEPPVEVFPLVDPHDDGIRPAGPPDACFYCQQKVGQSHKRDCVVVSKKVWVRYSFDVEIEVPHAWTPEQIEFHRGESSWCASNALVELNERYPDTEDSVCPCAIFDCTYLGTIDEIPRTKVRAPPEPEPPPDPEDFHPLW